MTINPQIIDTFAVHGVTGDKLSFESARQDRRQYYRLIRLTPDGRRHTGGALTDEKHALETIAYWQTKGWR